MINNMTHNRSRSSDRLEWKQFCKTILFYRDFSFFIGLICLAFRFFSQGKEYSSATFFFLNSGVVIGFISGCVCAIVLWSVRNERLSLREKNKRRAS